MPPCEEQQPEQLSIWSGVSTISPPIAAANARRRSPAFSPGARCASATDAYALARIITRIKQKNARESFARSTNRHVIVDSPKAATSPPASHQDNVGPRLGRVCQMKARVHVRHFLHQRTRA